ncbi:hypothetical protein BsWGS_00905 [Bradybaena similaris]
MTEFYNGRARRQSSGPRSFCARCGNAVEDARVASPGRGSWADKKHNLSLEIDGREGREVRRRHSSTSGGSSKQRGSPLHCYIIPVNNGAGPAAGATTSTYKESFRSPSRSQSGSRQVRSTPSSPVSTLSPWSSVTSSSFSPAPSPGTPQTSSSDTSSKAPQRFRGRDSSLDRINTTYKDHFTWLS